MSTESQPKAGRPSEYTLELVQKICSRIANGESLRSICQEETMPGKSTVMEWLAAHEHFRTIYAQAREVQADHMAEEILDIADDDSRDIIEIETGEEGKTYTREQFTATTRAKLKIDARFKLMALLAPKKYGTKHLDVTTDGQAITWNEQRTYAPDPETN
ncbi:terminase small subunit protein [Hymenobacter sediminis]|uniref:terminase small subunit-like protein n=1 Tax=Hymenobacter sediminis TaxID=2218621 RepID=UPI000DA686A9|nr:terminase small subunit protein [Hymenobacter sediminis]RPD50043.1 terminase small subunit protein [Hymenobacter sediminis]